MYKIINIVSMYVFTAGLLVIGQCESTEKLTVNIGVILPRNETYLFSIGKCVPAIKMGQDTAFREGYLNKNAVDFNIVYADSQCSSTSAPLAAFDFQIKNISDIFFGPCCDYSLAPVARYSQVWNKPVITTGGLAAEFGEKYTGVAEYSMLTRVLTEFSAFGRVGKRILENNNWKKAKIIYDKAGQNDVSFELCFQAVKSMANKIKKNRDLSVKTAGIDGAFIAEDILRKEIKNEFAVIFMCASPDTIREIMLAAHRLGFTGGEYVFFNMDLFGSNKHLARPWYRADKDDNEVAQSAYEAVLTITLKKPETEEYFNFSREVKEKAKTEFPNVQYADSQGVNSFVGAFHDAMLLYAMALNETIEANGDISDGAEITRRMWNRTFQGITGEVTIDSNGDRNTDYSLLNYNPALRKFDVVGHYWGYNNKYRKVRSIIWPGGSTTAPADTPKCGFDGARCAKRDPFPPWSIATTVFSLLLIMMAIIGVTVYWRYKQEAELNSMAWRIKSDEIILYSRRGAGKFGGGQVGGSDKYIGDYRYSLMSMPLIPLLPKHSLMASKMSVIRTRASTVTTGNVQRIPNARSGIPGAVEATLINRRESRMSYLSVDSINAMDAGIMGKQTQMYTQTALHTTTCSRVAVKTIMNKNVAINRAFLMEIKNIKNLQNDHIARLIGLCLDPGHEYIVTEYCNKGSLQDILENETLDIDVMFKHSLIQDIVKGMDYLHNSLIRYHGNLKSTNCVVDSRFVLKITDFGLSSLRTWVLKKNSNEEDQNRYQICKRQLWTAPELIDCNQVPSVQAYQKGDVYSFGIICQEVIYRMGVFYIKDYEMMPPEDIIDMIRQDCNFRPTLENSDCELEAEANLIRRCWAADPLERPDFPSIKSTYRRFNKQTNSKGGNLVDNLLSRMEQYANNLESLVTERTADYLEEKARAEELLYMMLPKSIAEDMVKGKSVEAEWFDQVTIYFSDICGFTALSAASTPMEVVALLNDLYTIFDRILEELDVYKVETIGDAYMVVSGLPNVNGINHAREIARMSLKLLEAVKTFKIQHKPEEKLKLRIGMHTGPVCAGIVGLKMPRYCLFGDTVNTASRMESNGEALKIHVSPTTKELLDEFSTFELSLRGEVEMKGKGKVTTYWLLGEKVEAEEGCSSSMPVAIPEESNSDLETDKEEDNSNLPGNSLNNNKTKHTIKFLDADASTPLLNGIDVENGRHPNV